MSDEERKKRMQSMLGTRDLIAWLCPACNLISGSRKVERNGRAICERCAQKHDEAYSSIVRWSSMAGASRQLKLEKASLTYTMSPDHCLSVFVPEFKMRIELLDIKPGHVDIYLYAHRLVVDAGELRNIVLELSGRPEAQAALDWFIGHRFDVINGLDMAAR
ncbi:hypothetical protein CSQ89_08395 [Chitinimonas sp. BJB300]|nr:hypothetical protein CSQ89_08395 [Chitinimonas sp. BJB300]